MVQKQTLKPTKQTLDGVRAIAAAFGRDSVLASSITASGRTAKTASTRPQSAPGLDGE